MSSEATMLINASKVLNSLKTESPLYLGPKFTIETDPNKRGQFSLLIAALNSRDPDFQKKMIALKAIASQQDPSSLPCFEKVKTAVSPILPMSQLPEPQMLQNDLSAILLALDLAVIMLNIICLEKLGDDLTREENPPGPLLKFGKCDGFKVPSTNSSESFALLLRWANFRRQSMEGNQFYLNVSSETLGKSSELLHIKKFSFDPETKRLASFIYFSFQMKQINERDNEQAEKLKKFSAKANRSAHKYLKKYNSSLIDDMAAGRISNEEQINSFSKFLSDENIYADYNIKYNKLKTLRDKSKKKIQFTSTYFHVIDSPGLHFSNAFPTPQELRTLVFEKLLVDVVVKTSDEPFIQFLQKTCGINCSSYIAPLEEMPISLPTLPEIDSSASSEAVGPQSSPIPSLTPTTFEPNQIMDSSSISGIFYRRTVQKHFPYHERVIEWFDDPAIPLSTDKYRSLSPLLQEEIAWKHCFPRLVDSFVGTEYCLEGQWQNKNALYFIPAEIEQGGRTFRGGFQYAFLPDGTCYHRCWGEKSNHELIDQLMNQTIWNEIDFPPLEEAVNRTPKPKLEIIDSFPVELDPRSGMVTFRDGNAKITLFKIGLEH